MEKHIKDIKRVVLGNQLFNEQKLRDLSQYNESRDSAALLHAAALDDQYPVAKQLIDWGISPNAVSPQGTTPLHAAARYNAEAVAELLLRSGGQPGVVDAASKTPLMVAAGLGHSGIVKQLLQADRAAGVTLELRDSAGNSALHLAAAGDHLEAANLLVTWGADALALNDAGRTPLDVARLNSGRRVGEFLETEHTEQRRRSARVAVGPANNSLVISVLLGCLEDLRTADRATLASRTPDGKSLLHWSAVRDSVTCADYLLGCGLGVDAPDAAGCTPLHYAALNNARNVCRLLLAAGADVNRQEFNGLTPLMLCATAASPDSDPDSVAGCILSSSRGTGANLRLTDREGETALMHAARLGKEALVRLVADGPANVLAKNNSGLSAIEISELFGHRRISEFLEGYRPSLDVDVYPRKYKKGYCLVINQMYKSPAFLAGSDIELRMREGSLCDVKRIYQVFQGSLSFSVHERPDLTSDAIIQQVQRIANSGVLADVDYFVCFLLAHGLGDAVLGTDGRLVKLCDIARQVDAEHCRDLRGKPKIFFIQACRNRDAGHSLVYWREASLHGAAEAPSEFGPPLDEVDEVPELNVARYIDFLFGFSTWEDCLSYRCKKAPCTYRRCAT